MKLAGDIGGTSTRLALVEGTALQPRLVHEHRYESEAHHGLDAIVEAFLQGHPTPERACFGIAGPVRDGRVETTNLPWHIDAAALAARFGFGDVHLINDLEAHAHGVLTLSERELVPLNPDAARQPIGNRAMIAAGTGLGEAGLFWDGEVHHPFPSEGGHSDFAPRSDRETRLLSTLRREWAHVSVERVLSGPGLVRIHDFLSAQASVAEPAWLREARARDEAAAAISRAAEQGTWALAVEALEMFVSIFGAEAGNLALKVMAVGGVYVGGGIAPRIRAALENGAFMAAFTDKGRMAALLRAIPVWLVLNDETALLGAARYAMLAGAGARRGSHDKESR